MNSRLENTIRICLFVMLFGVGNAAYGQADTLSGAKYEVVDRFSVNMASGQVQITQTPLSIGGDRGLRHTISSQTSDFVNFPLNGGGVPTILGFGDANRGGFYSVALLRFGQFPQDWQYGIRVFGGGINTDFALTPAGDFIPFNLPSSATLVFHNDSAFTGYVMTAGDGTRVYYPGSQITAIDENTDIRRRMSKIVYANGLTVEISASSAIDGPIYSVRTNTGFQLKYDHSNSWTSSSPNKVTALNNRVERCPTTSAPCTPSASWPFATYTWPVGEPDPSDPDSLRTDSIFAVQDAAGRVTEYHHSLYESETGDFAPRLVEITEGGVTVMTYDYEWNSHEVHSSSNHSIIQTTGIATVGTATAPGGGGQGYSMHIPRYHSGAHIGNINGGGTGPNRISFIESTNYGALVQIDTWEQIINFYYSQPYNSTHGLSQVENRITSAYQKKGAITTSFQYDSHGNVTQRDENGIITSAQYAASCNASNYKYCNKPEWIEDAKGNRTHYTYHPASGQIASITSPANDAGVQAKTVYQYDQYYAHYKIDSETIEAADDPVWLLTSETRCQNSTLNSNATCSGNDAITTTYEYDYHNLYRRGVAVTARNTQGVLETRRTCFEFDDFGNKIGETSPRANLSSCL